MNATFGTRLSGVSYWDREGAYAVAFDGVWNVALVEAPVAGGPKRGLFLPGGGIELGETSEDCIRRECMEETGREAQVGEYLCTGDEISSLPATGSTSTLSGDATGYGWGNRSRHP